MEEEVYQFKAREMPHYKEVESKPASVRKAPIEFQEFTLSTRERSERWRETVIEKENQPEGFKARPMPDFVRMSTCQSILPLRVQPSLTI